MPSLEYKITDENLSDILVTAFEGGINYWCCRASLKNPALIEGTAVTQLISGATLILEDCESDDTWELCKEKLITGVEKYVNEEDSSIVDSHAKEIDCGMVDAIVADCIIQYAVFGEIKFS